MLVSYIIHNNKHHILINPRKSDGLYLRLRRVDVNLPCHRVTWGRRPPSVSQACGGDAAAPETAALLRWEVVERQWFTVQRSPKHKSAIPAVIVMKLLFC